MNEAYIHILEILRDSGGKLKDRELYEKLKRRLEKEGVDISKTQFNKLLMTLELRGFIEVSQIRKNVRMVYLTHSRLLAQARG